MTIAEDGKAQIRYARLAGFMYLFLIAIYLLGIMIASRFEVPGNIAETAHRVMEHELLFRFGLALGSLNALCAVLLAVSLYVAVRVIDKNLALLALAFELVYVAVGAVVNLIDYAFLKQQLDAYSFGHPGREAVVGSRGFAFVPGCGGIEHRLHSIWRGVHSLFLSFSQSESHSTLSCGIGTIWVGSCAAHRLCVSHSSAFIPAAAYRMVAHLCRGSFRRPVAVG